MNNMEMVVNNKIGTYVSCCFLKEIQTLFHLNRKWYTANVDRQTTDKLLFSYAIITGKNM